MHKCNMTNATIAQYYTMIYWPPPKLPISCIKQFSSCLFIYFFFYFFIFFFYLLFFFFFFFFRIRNPYYCNRNCSCTFAKWERKNSVIGKYYSVTYWRLSKLPISCIYVEPFVLFNYYYFISLFIYLLFSF